MESRIHFLVTFISLLFLGVIVVKPETLRFDDDRECRIEKGRIDCHDRYPEALMQKK